MVGLARDEISFEHAPTLRAAYADEAALVKIVWGPVESGKTVWLCAEIYRLMCSIPRCRDGIRRSRFLLIRSTEAELQRGIMRTWKDWFPEDVYGPITGSMPAIQKLKFLDVEAEVEFFAFEDDSEAVLKKLRSTEYTAIGINEGQFTPLRLLLAARQRAGRYPKRVDCPEFDRQKRLFMDMNSPRSNDHFVLYMRGDIPLPADMPANDRRQYRKPDDWRIWKQPGSVRAVYDPAGEIEKFEINPEAENLPYQDEDAILSMCQAGDIDDIRRDYLNEVVQVRSGRPRYPKFRRAWHVAKQPLRPVEGVAPVIGYDPGLSGAAVFFQRVNGQWRGLAEMIARGDPSLSSAELQGRRMLDILQARFPWYRETGVTCWGDPYGDWGGTDKNVTFYTIVGELGLEFQSPAKKDNPTLRHQIGQKILADGSFGEPKLLLCPAGCPRLIDAMELVVMRQVKREGAMVTQEELVKNNYADPVEAAEYAWWGGGEDHAIVRKPEEERPPVRFEAPSRRTLFTRGRRTAWSR